MHINNQILLVRKILSGVMLLVVFFPVVGASSVSPVSARGAAAATPAFTLTTDDILSDGQFVYGPNVGDFDLMDYLKVSAPHFLKYAQELYGRSEYHSINPKIYLTLLEIHSHLISIPQPTAMENPFGMKSGNFMSQIEDLSDKMTEAYYLHLYSYSPLPVSQRNLKPFATSDGVTINVPPDINAGTYAIIAGLVAINEKDIPLILDNSQPNGFYQTYVRLFGNDDPLDEKNHIYIPGKVGALSAPGKLVSPLAAPDNLLQLPYLRGLSWRFGGVHNTGGAHDFTDASSLDFFPGNSAWGIDTSSMWVVASAAGIPTRLSACGFKILHSDGWETFYYHLENTQFISGFINQNDKIGVIANTLAEATCTGGAATGPHVHFSLRRNGAYVAINGTPLAGWYVHSGRYSYDVDPNYMWLERAGIKKYANGDFLLSEGPAVPPTVLSSVRDMSSPNLLNVKFIVTFSDVVTGVTTNDFTLVTTGVSGAAVSAVSGSNSVYTVTVNTGSGDGTIHLNLVDDDTIVSSANLPLAGAGAANGDFTSGETFTIMKNLNTYIGGSLIGSYFLGPSQSTRDSYAGIDNGPVRVTSTNTTPIISAIREAWAVNGVTTSFVQLMGLSATQLSDQYVFPAYNNVTLNDQLRIGNVDIVPSTVAVTIGGIPRGTYTLQPDEAVRINYAGLDSGPVVVQGTLGVDIISAIREAWAVNGVTTSFSQLMGMPAGQLSDEYVFPAYNNVTLNEQLRIGNVDTVASTVTVTIGGVFQGSYTLQANEAVRVNYAGVDSGPVVVQGTSGVHIIAAIREAWAVNGVTQSFVQLMGLPFGQLSSTYLFPGYNNVTLNEQLRIAVP